MTLSSILKVEKKRELGSKKRVEFELVPVCGFRNNENRSSVGSIGSVYSVYYVGSVYSVGSIARHRNKKQEKQGYILTRVPPRAGATNGAMARA